MNHQNNTIGEQMIFVRYYRNDLVTNEPTIEVYFTMLSVSKDLTKLHEQAVEMSKRHLNITAYQLYEGPHFKAVKPIGLRHSLV